MLAKRHLSKIRTYKPGKPIEEVKRQLKLKSVIKLASNENALAPSRRVLFSIRKAAKSLNRYPDGSSFYLKRELARRFRLKADNFIIGNGSDEVITFAIRAFMNKGDEVIIAKPTFLIYGLVAKIENVKARYIPLKNYKYDLASMKAAVTKKTKLIFIANPDNPTGSYVTTRELNNFVKGLRKDIILFIDEAYYEFARVRKDYPETLKILKRRGNVIITRSFSKAYSLAGLRIGYGISSSNLIEAMGKVREPFNVNSLAQSAALAALGDKRTIKKAQGLVKKGKALLYSEFNKVGIRYVPSATNFILFKISDSIRIYKKLLKKGVIVREMSGWGLIGFLRVTIGTMKENRRFIKTLREIL